MAFGRIFAACFAASAALLLMAGCGSGGGTSPATSPVVAANGPVSQTGRYLDLFFTATTPKRVYAAGEVVPITLTVQNTGTGDATFLFYTAGNPVIVSLPTDGRVSITNRQTSQTVRLLSSAFFTAGVLPTPKTLTLAAGQTQTLTLQWNQLSDMDSPAGAAYAQVAPGTYKISPFLSVDGLNGVNVPVGVLGTDALEIEIR